jgi:hypothetical protein
VQSLLTPRLPLQLAVAVPLLLLFLFGQPGMGLDVVLAVAVPLLLPLPVRQSGTGLDVVLAVAVPLLLLLPVRQPSTGLTLLLTVAGPLLFPARVDQPAKLMHFDLMCLHTNLHLHRILCKLHNNFRCYKFILHDKFLILGSWRYLQVQIEFWCSI